MTITCAQLELAAKAAGLQEHGWMGDTYCHVVDNTWATFDPLTDHGQLLDLVMALGFAIDFQHGVLTYWRCGIECDTKNFTPRDFTSLAEAIVTAAAEQ